MVITLVAGLAYLEKTSTTPDIDEGKFVSHTELQNDINLLVRTFDLSYAGKDVLGDQYRFYSVDESNDTLVATIEMIEAL